MSNKNFVLIAIFFYSMSEGFAQGPAQDTTTVFQYDPVGNLTRVTDSLNHSQTFIYDPLHRRKEIVDAKNGRTTFEYDARDNLIKVVDQRLLVTTYHPNLAGLTTETVSPDSVVEKAIFGSSDLLGCFSDRSGDARILYDSLGRAYQIGYSDGRIIKYDYDIGTFGIGRLGKITDQSGSIDFEYNQDGQVVSETRLLDGKSYSTAYRYEDSGLLKSMTYPSGRVVNYSRDYEGRVISISTVKDGITLPAILDVKYEPFGGLTSITFGNGQVSKKTYDLSGRILNYSLADKVFDVGYDGASRVVSLSIPGNAQPLITYGYDEQNQLTSYITGNSAINYSYDSAGNRSRKFSGLTNHLYTYKVTSNHLDKITGTDTKTFISDSRGSITKKDQISFTYDVALRMQTATTQSGTTTYTVNALGQRVVKSTPSSKILFHYDIEGRLIAESGGQTDVEYIFLENLPVAVMR